MEPAVEFIDGTCMVLGRRGIFLGKDTQDVAQLLNCGKKPIKKGNRKSIFISKFK